MNQPLSESAPLTEPGKAGRFILKTGAIFTVTALTGIVLDVIIGNITGGNLSALPHTAIERFSQLNNNTWLGLYNLDLLNAIVQLLLIPSFFALYTVHNQGNPPRGLLSLIVFLTGSVLLVGNNQALPMLELSHKYFSATGETEKMLYAAAGESLLAMGAHGSPGVFPGFFIPNIANLMISIVMLRGRVFSAINSWFGIAGSILMLLYVTLVNFVNGFESMATAIAMPGGLLLIAWMILFTARLIRLGKRTESAVSRQQLR
jgi:hypothetical protein